MDKINLPFVLGDEEGFPVDFWRPTRSGDYAEDCATGGQYAVQLLSSNRLTASGLLFQRIVEGMIATGRVGGVEIGFLSTVGACLSQLGSESIPR